MSVAARQPIDDCDHLIVNAKRVSESEEGVAGRFDPHDEAARRMIGVGKENTWKKTRDPLCIKIIGVAKGAVNIETKSFYAWKIQRHGAIVPKGLYFRSFVVWFNKI